MASLLSEISVSSRELKRMNVRTVEGVTIANVVPENKGRKMTPVYLFSVDNMLVDTGPSNMYETLRPFLIRNRMILLH
ncbi:hypothetical protein [Geomicrobium sp. JCM 19038]|uniref:hypothetical protein n=1 Tax=Geomicrobium sp. JCM 19038 TaxID=1460635 RepID=UPI0006946850|nr:hypothetical protein [Geomicrobium sp. JCM 19038]